MHILKSKRCFNNKSSTYYFHLKTKILAGFRICISVPSIVSDGRPPFSHSILFLYRDSVAVYIKRFFLPITKYFTENPGNYLSNILCFYFIKCWYAHPTYFLVLMLCCLNKVLLWNAVFHSDYCPNSNHLFFESKRKICVYRTYSMLTLMKSGGSFFRIDIIYMIYLIVKYFSAVSFSIYCEKLAVKTAVTKTGHFFAKKLILCLSDII